MGADGACRFQGVVVVRSAGADGDMFSITSVDAAEGRCGRGGVSPELEAEGYARDVVPLSRTSVRTPACTSRTVSTCR